MNPPSAEKCAKHITAAASSCREWYFLEIRIVHVLELAGGVMEELANAAGPRMDVLNSHCLDFMQSIKDIQLTLREEIKSACEYRPFEQCDYSSRVSNEICCRKLEVVMDKLDEMKETINECNGGN